MGRPVAISGHFFFRAPTLDEVVKKYNARLILPLFKLGLPFERGVDDHHALLSNFFSQ